MEKETATSYQALKEDGRKDRQAEIFKNYSPDQQQVILYRLQILSSLACFIGKDFEIPVELNELDAGWDWDYENNKIFIDPEDLIEKPMDYLRFKISYKAGHRRITRWKDIPAEVWRQPGFSFMMYIIEYPRVNNFVAEAYPRFAEQMAIAYLLLLDLEGKAKDKARAELGHIPRFLLAGFEYIKQWYREIQGEDFGVLTEDLPEEVKKVVGATLESARDSWLRYPSREEADQSEELIRRYAQVSYEINRDEIYPKFKKLVYADLREQKLQQFLQDIQGEYGGKGKDQQGLPQGLNDKLSESEEQELEEAIQNSQQSSEEGRQAEGTGKPCIIDLDSLSEGLKQKIEDHINSLPKDFNRRMDEKAHKALQDYMKAVNEELTGKLSETPDKKAERERSTGEKKPSSHRKPHQKPKGDTKRRIPSVEIEDQKRFRDQIEQILRGDENVYEEYRRKVLPLIDALETDLREILVARRTQIWQSGFRTGKRIDIRRRMQEKALGIPPVESKAWQRRELPQEKDYAISLLVDLSNSMSDEKIEETFKAVIVLAEVLNRLSISMEILGFNSKLYIYQEFGQNMGPEVRKRMGGMLEEVFTTAADWTDTGWAVQQASKRLAQQKPVEKFLIVLSDGLPNESDHHPQWQYDLEQVIKQILQNTDQRLIGLGVGPATKGIEQYFPINIANVSVEEMAKRLSEVIREAIVNYETF